MRAIESFTVAALLLGSLALPGLAMAQEGRVFIRFAGDKKTAQTLEEGSTRFISVVTESGEVAFAGSSDRDSIYAECRDDVGVSREVERECQLKAARRVFVEHLLEVEASQLEKGLWELTLSVWNPDDNARVHVSYEEVEAKTLDVAAREAYPKLALKYLCFRNEDFCDASIGPKPGRQCPVGQVATEETQNQCCWPGQGHNGKKCVGKVSACPDGFALSEDETECTLLACKPGQKRVSDIYCCWPEQGYAEGACVGAPSCPSGYFAHELECLPGNGKDEVAMSFVAAGKFSMGSKKAESKTAHELCKETGNNAAACDESWYDVEQPAHEVSLSAYFLDSYEVSNAQYQRCVDAGKCSAIDEAQCFVLTSAGWQQGKSLASEQLKSDRPVVCVSWVQAKDYCAFAGKRLPTEAEWEYAARGPSGWRYPWGDAWKSTLANWGEKGGWGGVDGYRTSAPVGSFPGGISPFGVHDLSGNVWEWVGDGWSDYEKGAQTDPTGVEGENRVMRGGGFGDAADSLRSTFRAAGPQSYAAAFLGFRCAASAEPK